MTENPEDPRRGLSAHLEAELETVLSEAEATVVALREELAEQRRRQQQHEQVERLEEHLANTTVRWEEVRVFFDQALQELRSFKAAEQGSPERASPEQGTPAQADREQADAEQDGTTCS